MVHHLDEDPGDHVSAGSPRLDAVPDLVPGVGPAGIALRPATVADVPAMAALNAAEVPRLGPLSPAQLTDHLARCDLAVVASDAAGRLAGFVLALRPGHAYTSPNYRFFEARGVPHLYVDRIAVAAADRRRGIASALSDTVEQAARRWGLAEVTCEVNVDPPNPGSLDFHARRGFVAVGEQDTGALRVRLLVKAVGA